MDVKTTRDAIGVYRTRDGSLIRELMHPQLHASQRQSLAEATIVAGSETRLHRHLSSEEIYHVLRGSGLLTLGDRQLPLAAGDTVCIEPGTAHCLRNSGAEDLVVLCCCSPPYSHEDTELLD